jgi:hypothetical protein
MFFIKILVNTLLIGMYQYQNSPKIFGSWVLGFVYSFGFGDLGIGLVLGLVAWGIWVLGSFGFG